jgi:hypothetical protein
MDCTLLRHARVFLHDHVADPHIPCEAFERKEPHRELDLAAGRVVGNNDQTAGVVEVKCAVCQCRLAGGTDQGLVVKEKRFRLIAIGRARQAFAMSRRRIQLRLSEPKATLVPKVGDKAAALQDGAGLAVESLPRSRPDHLHSVHTAFQTERCTVAGLVDHRLDGRAGRNGNAPAGQAAPEVPASAACETNRRPQNTITPQMTRGAAVPTSSC